MIELNDEPEWKPDACSLTFAVPQAVPRPDAIGYKVAWWSLCPVLQFSAVIVRVFRGYSVGQIIDSTNPLALRQGQFVCFYWGVLRTANLPDKANGGGST